MAKVFHCRKHLKFHHSGKEFNTLTIYCIWDTKKVLKNLEIAVQSKHLTDQKPILCGYSRYTAMHIYILISGRVKSQRKIWKWALKPLRDRKLWVCLTTCTWKRLYEFIVTTKVYSDAKNQVPPLTLSCIIPNSLFSSILGMPVNDESHPFESICWFYIYTHM